MKRHTSDTARGSSKKTKIDIPTPQLELGIDHNRGFFTQKTFFEPVDVKRFKDLLACDSDVIKTDVPDKFGLAQWAMWAKTRRAHLAKVLKNYDPIEKAIKVKYQFADKGKAAIGRNYPAGGASAGEIVWELRGYLLYGLWTAFDVENCHPSIAYQVLKANGMESDFVALKHYCTNRNDVLKKVQDLYNVQRGDSKLLFIRLLYGGTFEAWAKDTEVFGEEKSCFIESFESEMARIGDVIVKANPLFAKTIKPNTKSLKIGGGAKRGPKGKSADAAEDSDQAASEQEAEKKKASTEQIVSYWLQEHERRVLRSMYEYLVSIGLIDDERPECMLRYDGVDLPLTALLHKDKESILQAMGKHVYKMTGLNLVMTEKPYEENTALKEEVSKQLDYMARIPEEFRDKLDVGTLCNLTMYPAQKWYFEKFTALIVHESYYAVTQRKYIECVNETDQAATLVSDNVVTKKENDLGASFRHVKSTVYDKAGEPKVVPFLKTWLFDQEKRYCDSVGFVPFNKDEENFPGAQNRVLNLFKGYSLPRNVTLVQPAQSLTYAFHYIGLQLCGNDPRVYQFFWSCLCRKVRHPRKRLGMAFVFQDKTQGSGADVFFNAFGRLLGDNHYTNTANVHDVLGDHAEGLEHRLMVVLNELKFERIKGSEDALKALITADKHTVNPKGIRPYDISLFALIIFVSNHLNAISFDNDDNERRMAVFAPTFHCIAAKMRDQNWGFSADDWTYLTTRLFKSPIFIQALYEDIMASNLSRFNPEEQRLSVLGTEYYRASERNSKLHAKFFAHMLRSSSFDKFVAAPTNPSFFPIASPETSPETSEWIIPEVGAGVNVQIRMSQLHELFYTFVEDKFKTKARQDETDFKDLFNGNGPYAGVFQTKKSSVMHYVFNTRALWEVLVEKKWVTESEPYYKEQSKDAGKDLVVEQRFNDMSTLLKRTPLEERDAVNPGRQRPL